MAHDVDATSLRRIDVITTSCAYWEFGPPWLPNILNLAPPNILNLPTPMCMYESNVCYVFMYVLTYVRTYVRTYGWMDGWMDSWMYVCMYVCMYV